MSVTSGSGILNGVFTSVSVRPTGYQYPIGLTIIARIPQPMATGGTTSTDGSNIVHTFTSSDSFVPSFTGNVEYLVVAGGGGGAAPPGR